MSWHETLEGFVAKAWQELERGVADRHHPARHLSFGTIGDYGPSLRTVVLRGADEAARTLEVHTDRASAKVADIERDPRVALHAWIPLQRLQIRVSAQAELIHGDPARWARVPEKSGLAYGGAPRPGLPIAAPQDHTPGATIERFTAVLCHVTRMDTVYLGEERHLRAVYSQPAWSGSWVAP
ncbi:MAG: pyridoxamine 5'-phosphate oxidase family protein [Pseudomonadota bacterium]